MPGKQQEHPFIVGQTTHLISFRIRESQYEQLRSISATQGARSLSSFVRWAITRLILNADRTFLEILGGPAQPGTIDPEEYQAGVDDRLIASNGDEEPMAETIQKLRERVDEMGRELDGLSRIVKGSFAQSADR